MNPECGKAIRPFWRKVSWLQHPVYHGAEAKSFLENPSNCGYPAYFCIFTEICAALGGPLKRLAKTKRFKGGASETADLPRRGSWTGDETKKARR